MPDAVFRSLFGIEELTLGQRSFIVCTCFRKRSPYSSDIAANRSGVSRTNVPREHMLASSS
jgi:hypothetical protein